MIPVIIKSPLSWVHRNLKRMGWRRVLLRVVLAYTVVLALLFVFMAAHNVYLHNARTTDLLSSGPKSASSGRPSSSGVMLQLCVTNFAVSETKLSGKIRLFVPERDMSRAAEQLDVSLDSLSQSLLLATDPINYRRRDDVSLDPLSQRLSLAVEVYSVHSYLWRHFSAQNPILTEIPFSELQYEHAEDNSMWYVPMFQFELQTLGHPGAYPFDYYYVQPRVEIWIKDKKTKTVSGNLEVSHLIVINEYPFHGSGLAAIVDENKDVILSRVTSIQTHTVMMFFLMGILVAFTCLFLLDRSMRNRYGIWEGITGTAAIMLSLLPMRAVLVPEEIEALTTVDAVFGLYLAVLIACIIVRIGLEVGDRIAADKKSHGDASSPAKR